MNEFFNWHDSWILVEHHVLFILLALFIGVLVGWFTCDTSKG